MTRSYGQVSSDVIASRNYTIGMLGSAACKLCIPGLHYEMVASQRGYNDNYEQASL